LLNDDVSKEVVGVRALAWVSNSGPSNISYVVQKRQHLKLTNNSQWALITRRQCYDVLDATTVSCVLDWWSKDTWVSPNKLDAPKKLITLKVYEEHIMHMLMETQVKHDYLLQFFWPFLLMYCLNFFKNEYGMSMLYFLHSKL
jgi:hypothetical protein